MAHYLTEPTPAIRDRWFLSSLKRRAGSDRFSISQPHREPVLHRKTGVAGSLPARESAILQQSQQFFNAIGSAMPALSALGVEPLALGKVDQSKLHSAAHTFFAVWRCPDDTALVE